MDAGSRRTVQVALYAIALVLFFVYFGRDFWDWAMWNENKDAIDLGIVKIGARPPFPNAPRHVLLGLITPIVLVASGTIVGRGQRV